jgi:hypothetical protein
VAKTSTGDKIDKINQWANSFGTKVPHQTMNKIDKKKLEKIDIKGSK